jgi:hypothetical protein
MRPSSRHGRSRRGFTLLETALAMVIVMVGVLAMIEAQGGFIRSNSWSSHEATATYLANEIRERMRSLPRHDPVSGLSLVTGGSGQPQAQGVGRESGEITVQDFDDADDYDGVSFGQNGNFDGPIDGFGTIIPETDVNGVIQVDPQTGQPLPLQGWTQSVTVEKVNPYDYSIVRPWAYTEAASGAFPGRQVDQYPVRVTVSVSFQGPLDPQPEVVTTMTWIIPAN